MNFILVIHIIFFTILCEVHYLDGGFKKVVDDISKTLRKGYTAVVEEYYKLNRYLKCDTDWPWGRNKWWHTCRTDYDEGDICIPGNPSQHRYYFHYEYWDEYPHWKPWRRWEHCTRFLYLGCGGNENNFEWEIDCTHACRNKGNNIPAKCLLPKEEGKLCWRTTTMWFYSNRYKDCLSFEYGGCNGTSSYNRFFSREECLKVCVRDNSANAYDTICYGSSYDPLKNIWCHLDIDRKHELIGFTMWYYHVTTYGNETIRTCKPFTYQGCGGGRFFEQNECENACIKSEFYYTDTIDTRRSGLNSSELIKDVSVIKSNASSNTDNNNDQDQLLIDSDFSKPLLEYEDALPLGRSFIEYSELLESLNNLKYENKSLDNVPVRNEQRNHNEKENKQDLLSENELDRKTAIKGGIKDKPVNKNNRKKDESNEYQNEFLDHIYDAMTNRKIFKKIKDGVPKTTENTLLYEERSSVRKIYKEIKNDVLKTTENTLLYRERAFGRKQSSNYGAKIKQNMNFQENIQNTVRPKKHIGNTKSHLESTVEVDLVYEIPAPLNTENYDNT